MKRRVLGIFFISLILIAAGFIFLRDMAGPSKKTEAVITRIERYFEPGMDEEQVDVYVDYTVEGTRYHDILLGSYDLTMDEGDKITVSYQVAHPENIHTGGAVVSVVVLFVCGGLGLLYSGGAMIWVARQLKRQG